MEEGSEEKGREEGEAEGRREREERSGRGRKWCTYFVLLMMKGHRQTKEGSSGVNLLRELLPLVLEICILGAYHLCGVVCIGRQQPLSHLGHPAHLLVLELRGGWGGG